MTKLCFIMRGLPGSGKSTVARQILRSALEPGQRLGGTPRRRLQYQNRSGLPESILTCTNFCVARIHSTDTYFYDSKGTYNFDPGKLAEYHEVNYDAFVHDVEIKWPVELVIVDNTNSQTWEWKKYHETAINAGYITSIIEMPHPPVELCFSRNTHGVPLEGIRAMQKRWQPTQQ